MACRTPVRTVITFLAVSAGGGCAFIWTIAHPDSAPVIPAVGLSWLITIAVCVGTLACQMVMPLEAKPHRVAAWEQNGAFYEWVGIRAFRWLLLHTQLRWLSPELQLGAGRSDLGRLLRGLDAAERVHAVAAGVSLVLAAALAASGRSAMAAWLVLVTIPVHAYPVMLQRWNRARVRQVLRRGQ